MSNRVPAFESQLDHLTEAEAEEFLRSVLKRPLREVERDFRYVSKHYDELKEQYPDEWVLIFEHRVLAHGRDHNEIIRRMEELGLRDYSPEIVFLHATPVNLVL